MDSTIQKIQQSLALLIEAKLNIEKAWRIYPGSNEDGLSVLHFTRINMDNTIDCIKKIYDEIQIEITIDEHLRKGE